MSAWLRWAGKRPWLAALAAVAVAVIAGAVIARGGGSEHYFTASIERGDIADSVDATGTVNPVTIVQVGSQVSGAISKLYVDFNSRVRRGDVVATIDPALFLGALAQAQADVRNAQANVPSAVAAVDKAKAALIQAEADYRRLKTLVDQDSIAPQAFDSAAAARATARANLAAAEAGVVQARAQLQQKLAALGVAQTNYNYTIIRSPIDGVVTARNVDVGQTVAASLQAPTLFNIAQDLTKMRVFAKLDEADVGRVRPGQTVTFQVDAFPKETFHGVLSQIRMNPTTIQNVVTYDAVVEFANPNEKILPGMTAFVSMPVASVHDVIKAPNGALRWRPALPIEKLNALYARYGVKPGRADRGSAPGGHAVLWVLEPSGRLRPVEISAGLTDHAFTEVKAVAAGRLAVGDKVVTGAYAAKGPPGSGPAGAH